MGVSFLPSRMGRDGDGPAHFRPGKTICSEGTGFAPWGLTRKGRERLPNSRKMIGLRCAVGPIVLRQPPISAPAARRNPSEASLRKVSLRLFGDSGTSGTIAFPKVGKSTKNGENQVGKKENLRKYSKFWNILLLYGIF